MMDLTIAVCTYRRGPLLQELLESLCRMQAPDLQWELVIVDNAVEEHVRQLVNSYSDRLPIRYVPETVAGCSNARNRAVESATAPIVLFTDDDAIVDEDWLVQMVAAIREHPEYDFWGGAIRPRWGTDRPRWFNDILCPMLRDVVVQYDAGSESRPWVAGQDLPFFTCNLALKVAAIRKAGMFDTALGHVGAKRVGNEDTRLQEVIVSQGGRGWYVARAIVDHPVPIERVKPEYALDFARRQGMMSVDFLAEKHGGQVPRWLYRSALTQGVHGFGTWLRGVATGKPEFRFAGRMFWTNASAKVRRALQVRS